MSELDEIIQRGYGTTKRYKEYYGGNPIPGGEVVWEVKTDRISGVATLYHYGVALVSWPRGERERAVLSEYASNGDLTKTDIGGIRKVNKDLL